MIPPGLESVLRLAAERRERRGWLGDARITVARITTAQADALDGLPWPGQPPKPFVVGATRTISVARLEAALDAAGLRPAEVYAAALGRPLRDLPAERDEREAIRDAFWCEISSHPTVATCSGLQAWFERARRVGQVTPANRLLVTQALRVVEWALSSGGDGGPIDRAVLAAQLFGRPHALDAGTALELLARQLLAATLDASAETPPRQIWSAAGVEVDPTSTSVLTLCLPVQGATALEVALRALHGTHVVLTLGQLESERATWEGRPVYVCENPSTLRVAERALGPECPPLVCAAGWPTDAVRLLLRQLRASDATLLYHGDFDYKGVAIFRLLEREVGVTPWRYDAEAYRIALAAHQHRDLPPSEATGEYPSGALERAIAVGGRVVSEELLVETLVADLREARVRLVSERLP